MHVRHSDISAPHIIISMLMECRTIKKKKKKKFPIIDGFTLLTGVRSSINNKV